MRHGNRAQGSYQGTDGPGSWLVGEAGEVSVVPIGKLGSAHVIERKRVIALKALKAFWDDHPDAETALRGWYKTVRKSAWVDFASVRETFGSADLAGKCVVFNIGGNKYRLIAAVNYQSQAWSNDDGGYLCVIT
jgi:mRNA interferase HigB